MRGAPQRRFLTAVDIRTRHCESMHAVRDVARAIATAAMKPIAMPTVDCRRLDQNERLSPPRPQSSQDQP